jgi:hypothetical protein
VEEGSELLKEQEQASVSEKCTEHFYAHFHSIYPTAAGSSVDSHRFTGDETGLKKSEVLTIDMESSTPSIFLCFFTAVIPLLGKRSVLVRN